MMRIFLAAVLLVAVLASCGPERGSEKDQPARDRLRDEAPAKTVENAGQDESGQEENRLVASRAGGDARTATGPTGIEAPRDKTLELTVPKMAEVKNDEIPSGLAADEHLFRDHAAVRLEYTGYPWQEEANVFIAGHRIGYPNTDSDMAFYDIEDLAEGDVAYLTDSENRTYTYEVFNKLVVLPTNLSVLAPVEGKNILSLQSCTLPDYSERVIYQARLKNVDEGPQRVGG